VIAIRGRRWHSVLELAPGRCYSRAVASPPVHPYRQHDVDLSGAIRSIRIAVTLNERFGVIAQPKTYHSGEQLSDMLSEARQLYPEIWRHLDDARKALAQRGNVVAAYDELRGSDAARAPAILDVEAKDSAQDRLILPITGGVVKTARLNLAGHAAATEACNALRRALPDVDWQALDRAEAQEIEAIGSLRPGRWKAIMFGVIGFGILVVLGALLLYLRISSAGR
jgi:hypothetical protein